MIAPTVRVGGTSSDTLVDGYTAAMDALLAATEAVNALPLNGRDYQPADFAVATSQRAEMLTRLQAMRDELYAVAESIANA